MLAFARPLLIVAMLGCIATSSAEEYPSKFITIVVPYPAGGSIDFIARLVGKRLGEELGQPLVVKNMAGGSGILGTRAVARAEPDGHTLVLANAGPNAIAPSLYSKLDYDIEKDFAPISLVSVQAHVFAVPAASSVKSIQGLVAFGRASDKGTFGSAGLGVGSHLTGELFQLEAGTRFTHVPYKGTAPLTVALLRGEISMAVLTTVDAVPHLKSGKIRALAIASPERLPQLPDVPTVGETVLPGFGVEVWYGLMAPGKTPKPVIERLNREVVGILTEPEVKERISAMAAVAKSSTPEQFAALIKAEAAKYARIVKAVGLAVE